MWLVCMGPRFPGPAGLEVELTSPWNSREAKENGLNRRSGNQKSTQCHCFHSRQPCGEGAIQAGKPGPQERGLRQAGLCGNLTPRRHVHFNSVGNRQAVGIFESQGNMGKACSYGRFPCSFGGVKKGLGTGSLPPTVPLQVKSDGDRR